MSGNDPAVEATGIVKRFGDRVALDGVDFVVRAGEVHGLLGPNGAGKSTLLGVLFGLVRPDAGTVKLLGGSGQGSPGQRLDRVAGFVADPRFYPYLSGRRNLELLAELDGDLDRRWIERVLTRVSLADRAQDRVAAYSTGMRQRLAIAAALLRSPHLLVLDEPTTGLDPAGIRDFRSLVRDLADRGLTVLLSSHDMAEVAELCDSVTIMQAGRVKYRGLVSQMRAQAPDPAYRLRTADDVRARATAAGVPGVRVEPHRDGGLAVRAGRDRLDAYVVALGTAGAPVRELSLEVAALEALFFRLVEGDDVSAPVGVEGAPVGVEGAPLGVEGSPVGVGRAQPPVPATPSVGVDEAPVPRWRAGAGVGAGVAYRVEMAKLVAQSRTRVALAVCLLAPFLFVAVLSLQSGVPQDTLFGRWVHESGFAVPLVVLGFAAQWVLPALTSIVAGDIFATEDHLGTWPGILTRGCSRRALFAGKTLAALTFAGTTVVVLGAASLAAGVLVAGSEPLVDLSGGLLSSRAATALVALSWASALLPVAGFTGLAVLVSIVSRRSTVGIGLPVVIGLVMQLGSLTSAPPAVQELLVTNGFDAWHGLAVTHRFTGPLWQAAGVSIGYLVVCLALGWAVLRRRDITARS